MSHIVIVSLPYHDYPQERKCKPCLNKWLDKVFDENVHNFKQIFEMTNSDNVHINQNLFLAMIPILALFSRFLLQGLGVGRTILISEDFILKKIKFVVKIVEMLKVGVGTKSSSNQSSSSSFSMLSGTVPYCHSSGKGQPI